jgi:heat shock protein HslJ
MMPLSANIPFIPQGGNTMSLSLRSVLRSALQTMPHARVAVPLALGCLTLGATVAVAELAPTAARATIPAAAVQRPAMPAQHEDVPQLAQASLLGSWTLVGWGDEDNLTPLLDGTEITAEFMGDQLGGGSGCNRYTTSYEVNGNELSFGPVASTRRACEPPILDQEMKFLAALDAVAHYHWGDRGELVLHYVSDTDEGVLVFTRPAIRGLW